ncbi:MAG: 30S ribosomal protein S12 methylthiotransferase RimO [Epulopiscium sp.]|nr:30S ribosomal protein S12 methylthiotransferase RimO [Candidatus Epulonipiscium sp.]
MSTSIAFVSLGCDKNLIDSENMLGLLKEAGFNLIIDEAQAEVIVINTCCFIQEAQEESIDTILQMALYKKEGKCKALIVTGCMAERYKKEIMQEIPEIDGIIGTTAYDQIVPVIQKVLQGEKVEAFSDLHRHIEIEGKRILSTPGYYAYLKIAEGCNNHCSYCIIPKIRGNYRSRSIESLLQEAKTLVQEGVRELIIVAQDVTRYGQDLYNEKKLPELLTQLCQIEDLRWIRLLYCYPEEITDELIQVMVKEPKICRYIDMPIQHANDDILRRMGRRSNQKQLRKVMEKLRQAMPDICLRTTLITGFPGETQEQFEDLYAFVKEMKFDRLGVFTYSREEGTKAATFSNQIPEEIKEERRNQLMELQQKISAELSKQMIGQKVEVLIEGQLPEQGVYCGRTYKDAPDVDGMVFVPVKSTFNDLLSGDFITVRIQEAYEYDVVGEMIK